MVISQEARRLIEKYQQWKKDSERTSEEEVISVDEVVARVAFFYEKLREIVDWRGEHLLRKTAIERILRRRLVVHKVNEDFAENFLSELVRGGHFPNNRISYTQVAEIQAIIEKYVSIINRFRQTEQRNGNDADDWLVSLAAVEIEETLSVPRRERALIELMTEDLESRVQLIDRESQTENVLPEGEKKLQVYVAVQRALFKLDEATIAYHVIERFYPDWKQPSEETLAYVGENLTTLYDNVQSLLSHPFRERFYQLAEKYDTPYLLLHDILSEGTGDFLEQVDNPAVLEDAIKQAYNKRHARLKKRIGRAALYSVLSVFATKILIALFIEVPIERYFTTDVNEYAILASVAIPSFLMMLLVFTAPTTSPRNLERVMMEVIRIIQEGGRKEPLKISPPRKRGGFVATIVYGFYLLSFLLSFGILVFILQRFHFSPISIAIFLIFTSLVLFAGTRIRQQARELIVEPAKEGFLYNVFDVFSLPMIQVGRWLSGQIVKYNIFLLVLNFLVEAPFQMLLEFLEQWRSFLREKKEEIH